MTDLSFYRGKCVLVTGHTGFKGTWLCHMLDHAGAKVVGYALYPPTDPSLFDISKAGEKITSVIGDIRDFPLLCETFEKYRPDIVFHLAAQPIVRESYKNPRYTYETNVMGTVNVLESIRKTGCVKSFLNVTTDKVYENREWQWGYRENENLNGFDPYSNSKSCSELVTSSYKKSFFADGRTAISTARAGNVIGGGDFAADRIIPDCVRAAHKGETIILRNPNSVRPYQHVLEPLYAYMLIAKNQYENISLSDCYNVGPDECDCVTTGELADIFCSEWGEDLKWKKESDADAPHEANFLKLDCSKLKSTFGWRPVWHVDKAVKKTVEWTKSYLFGRDIHETMNNQINEFLSDIDK
ncbi:MAG: CDP-glucose 4,6-dehydratase [Clostridiales bacterium]|nr:CDP-glucose 4,6-dehydratase [Clostridiales bacterium]